MLNLDLGIYIESRGEGVGRSLGGGLGFPEF